jgi:putative flippase GtrA
MMPGSRPPDLRSMAMVHSDAVRFVLLSGCCWCFDLTLLLGLNRGLGWPPLAANIASSLAAAAVVYTVSHRFIHDGARHGQPARLAAYLCYTLVVILAASALLGHLHDALSAMFAAPAVVTIVAKAAVTPPQLLCNFIVSRLVARAHLS